MGVELESVFSPEVLAVLDERMRKMAEETRGAGESEWLDVPGAMAYTSSTEHHVRQLIKGLQAAGSEDVYQPNGHGRKPLLVRRSALKDLTGVGGLRALKKGGKK